MKKWLGVFVGLLLCVGVASANLLDSAYKIRIINNSDVAKGYLVKHTKNPAVWINIMKLQPQGIFYTRLIPGRYSYQIFDVDDYIDDYHISNVDTGYFSVDEEQLKRGYIIFLKEYPYDNQGKDWTQ